MSTRTLIEKLLKNVTAERDALTVDARRYRRLRVIGVGVLGHGLADGFVQRFTNLDSIVDADLKAQPSRGEAESAPSAGGKSP